jgi:acetoacetate decarboxylase
MTAEATAARTNRIEGRLDREHFGASMPVDAPYYQSPPFYYRNAQAMIVSYETEAEAAAGLLPKGVALPLPARARLMVVHYPVSTFGPYNEAILGIQCEWEGEDHVYVAHIVVDAVPPLVGGREIWGYPKTLAAITLEEDSELLCGTVERPAGVRLVTAAMRREQPLEMEATAGINALSLRVIPSAEAGQPPSVAELIRVPSTDRKNHEAWSGPATLRYDAGSTLDPWHSLPVRQVLGAVYSVYDFTLPHGRVIRRY